jgi:hypothetical protein
MHGFLNSAWGSLTPELAISQILPRLQTGDHHAYIADLSNKQLYISFAANDNSTSVYKMAYERAFAKIDLESLFNTPMPTMNEKEESEEFDKIQSIGLELNSEIDKVQLQNDKNTLSHASNVEPVAVKEKKILTEQ